MQPNEITAILNLPISQELLARDLLRMAYVAKDGTPPHRPDRIHLKRLGARRLHHEERPEAARPAAQPRGRADDRHRGAPADLSALIATTRRPPLPSIVVSSYVIDLAEQWLRCWVESTTAGIEPLFIQALDVLHATGGTRPAQPAPSCS
ncbi:hypothetical protein AB4305_13225 [Nocardia sp. 2YAB30]|uniref:hypothetical protein n=1 Tax=unclassified Nocardia TaxID=2637762 RepID=UPI003F9887EC